MSEEIANVDMARAWDGEEGDQWTQFADEYDNTHRSIWARFRWGHWWEWKEDQLVLFLILFLFYCAYFMLRYSLPPGPQRANLSAVYALFGVALIPVSVLAIRLSQRFIHPVAFNEHGTNMAASQFFTFCVALVAMLTLAATMYTVELAGKRLDINLRELREALQ